MKNRQVLGQVREQPRTCDASKINIPHIKIHTELHTLKYARVGGLPKFLTSIRPTNISRFRLIT